ncbi:MULTISPECIES: TetR/AcrR family transcriptional regulator [unclassified Rhizobium]|uniref:TetR/AcrR family transcriptional regulator n=1 Tax=unclassified Rhizobium TaxID=2613769 RepID=UPI001A982856|nr:MULTISPECIES: TetR/AcrR family transcriptional regulator [unclassified Rhizobium]MBX5158565.1 TetR/AcrR family transcriptional regulator [Rhizobium sp. NZLR8]MBX5164031.1 TetR/AcrR family transcriptional regulator [Rhizobium sp. NZLR4b]MBX5171506.1 TetR/AcrR family transcriptional regulator [Rhizobium sp. NZLR1b]MBX5183570.1 TetR/AcrR family transcriptional regulator [Rhizobium sp. NZLR5]MBX5192144.1 TetR/AcrR family transcriptional regulator [Rhizobium sp. NZLR3b]
MARHKEFDRNIALHAAIGVFSEHGYEGTSTEKLLTAMKISRQSMYDTFGDKRGLYLEALTRYNTESTGKIMADLHREGRPIEALEGALVAFASRPAAEARRGCLGVSAICEFGRTDAKIAALTDSAGHALHSAIESLLDEAQRAGELGTDIDIADAIQFLGSALSGMKISARNGASPDILRGIARMAIRSLR